MAERILVVDGNAAFATVLKEILETEGGYEVRVAPGAIQALAILEGEHFDLTIVDMDLDPQEMTYRELIRHIHRSRPAMRLVLIPLMGQAVPREAYELHLQGTLSKPFFADDLLPRIKGALSAPLSRVTHADTPREPARAAAAPAPARRAADVQLPPRAQDILHDLAREAQADLVAVVSLEAGGRVLCHAGNLGAEAAEPLAAHCVAIVRSAQGLARFLGQPDTPFEHNMFESQGFRLYVLSVAGNLCLFLAAPLGSPLGAVRQNLRRAGRELFPSALT